MMYMLDMDICIYAIKHKPEQVFQHMQEKLQKGLYRATLTRFLAVMEILPFDGAAANAYGKNMCLSAKARNSDRNNGYAHCRTYLLFNHFYITSYITPHFKLSAIYG